MGAIALSSPFIPLNQGSQAAAVSLPWSGNAIAPWRYTGSVFDFAADGTNGAAVVPTLGTVPADACAVEMWVNGNAADDYIFVTTVLGQLAATGAFATNISANLLAVRWAASGAHIIIPFLTLGSAPTLRVATGKAGARIQGRFLAAGSGYPYLLGSVTNNVLTGAGAVQQLAFSDASRFPVGYCGALIQVLGTGPARAYWDGTAPSATTGDLLPIGTYLVDQALHGVPLSALRFFLPSGTNLVAHSLVYA